MMGMDHSQVNPQVALDCTGATGCLASEAEGIPTMYPILLQGAKMETLHEDDREYFLRLYGDTSNTCSVSGTIFASDGTTEVRGVEVVARNTDPNQTIFDAQAFVSGAEAPRVNDFSSSQGNCKSNCGDYLITNLKNGGTYQLCVQKINATFTGGSSMEPVDPPFQGFSDNCPNGMTVTCDCSSGCLDFTGKNVITDADPNAIQKTPTGGPNNLTGPQDSGNPSGGGCNLAKPRLEIWPQIQKLLEFSLKIQ
jgi:hypothetical protein